MSKYDGTKTECGSRVLTDCGTTCSIDGKSCTETSVCRHRSGSVDEMTNEELAAAVKTETDSEKANEVIYESAIRLMDMMNPNTKMLNVEGDEMSPLEMFADLDKCKKALDGIRAQIDKLDDLGIVTNDNGESAVEKEALGNEAEIAELRHETDKLSMENAIFVTEADFERISSALQSSSTVEEWIEKIRSITGNNDIDQTKHIVKCQPTERSIEELFKLKGS